MSVTRKMQLFILFVPLTLAQLTAFSQMSASAYQPHMTKNASSAPQFMPLSADEAEKPSNILGMTAGLGIGKFRYVVENERQYNFDYCVSKYAGVSVENFLNVFDQKISINNELLFSTFSTSASDHYNDSLSNDPAKNYYDVSLKYSPGTITLVNMVRYKLTKSDFRYYIGLGVYNSFVVSSDNKKEIIHTVNGTQTSSYEDAIPKQAIHGLMLLASTGFSYRNIGFELRFDPGRNYSNKLNYSLYMPNFIAMLQVQFNPRSSL